MALVNHTGPFDFVIFGATGDLSRRKLLPAFLRRFHAQEFSDDAQTFCGARPALNTEQFREQTESALREFAPETAQNEQTLHHFLGRLTYITLDALQPGGDWQALKTLLAANDRPRVFYLATAPALYSPLCEALARHDLINQHSRVVLEKPIGVNLETAQTINHGVGQFFPEASIYRIDHYLGKEGVQNILALRFANPMLEKLWSSEAIAHVQITAAETVGVGSRGSYYDES